MPRKLLIKPNLTKKNAANCARRVCAILGQLGAEALMEESLTPEFGGCENLRFLPEEAPFPGESRSWASTWGGWASWRPWSRTSWSISKSLLPATTSWRSG